MLQYFQKNFKKGVTFSKKKRLFIQSTQSNKEGCRTMRMWKLKKWNRGLILGGVLIVGLVVFLLVKSAQFEDEVPEIREKAEAYVQDFITMQYSPTGAEWGKILNEADREAERQELYALIEKYWDTEEEPWKGVDASAFIAGYEKRIDGVQNYLIAPAENAPSVEAPARISEVRIKENGPDHVVVSIQVETVRLKIVGYDHDQVLYTPNQYGYTDDYISKPPYEGMEKPLPKDYFPSGHVTLDMVRVDGEWRIIAQNSNFYR